MQFLSVSSKTVEKFINISRIVFHVVALLISPSKPSLTIRCVTRRYEPTSDSSALSKWVQIRRLGSDLMCS